MIYKIIISLRAQQEIEDAIDYYAKRSSDAPKDFISDLNETYSILSENPHFRICYKNVRTIILNVFPDALFYTITKKNIPLGRFPVFITNLIHNEDLKSNPSFDIALHSTFDRFSNL